MLGTIAMSIPHGQAQTCKATMPGSGRVNFLDLAFDGPPNVCQWLGRGIVFSVDEVIIDGFQPGDTLEFTFQFSIRGNLNIIGSDPVIEVNGLNQFAVQGNIEMPKNTHFYVSEKSEASVLDGTWSFPREGTSTFGGAGKIYGMFESKMEFDPSSCADGGCPSIILDETSSCVGEVCNRVKCAEPLLPVPIMGKTEYCANTDALVLTAGARPPDISYVWSIPSTASKIEGLDTAFVSKNKIQETDAGTYSVAAVRHNCISDFTSLEVTVNPQPAQPIISKPVGFCLLGEGVLSLEEQGPGSFEWFKSFPDRLIGTGSQHFIQNVSLNDTGTYFVLAFEGMCPSDTSRIVVRVDTVNNWRGTIDKDWDNKANWGCNRVPSLLEHVVIGRSGQHPAIQSRFWEATVGSLTILNGGQLDLLPEARLSITGNWSNAGWFSPYKGSTVTFMGDKEQHIANLFGNENENFYNLTVNKPNGKLVADVNVSIGSDATLQIEAGILDVMPPYQMVLLGDSAFRGADRAARLGPVKGSITAHSNFAIERYVCSPFKRKPYTAASPSPVVYLATPLQHVTVAQWIDDLGVVYNAKSSTIATFSERNGTGTTLEERKSRGWRYVMSNKELLEVGRGYKVSAGIGQSSRLRLIYEGEPLWGPFGIPVTHTIGATEGWNLLGNPYPSEIDWQALYHLGTNSTLIEPAFYILDPYNSEKNNSSFFVYHALTGLMVDVRAGLPRDPSAVRFIPSSQGFFVKALKNGVLQFEESIKPIFPEESNYSYFRTESESEVVRLTLLDSQSVAQTVVHFKQGASNAYEPATDAEYMGNGKLALFTQLGDKKLAINGIESLERPVPLIVKSEGLGMKTLRVTEFSANKPVYLHDTYTDKYVSLAHEVSYSFEVSSDTFSRNEGRFRLTGQSPKVTNSMFDGHESAFAFLLYPNPFSGEKLTVELPASVKEEVLLEMFDNKGVLVHQVVDIPSSGRIHPSFPDGLLPGVYAVRCTVANASWIERLVIK